MGKSEIKYQYAYDENGNRICIKKLSANTKHDHSYTCINCGNKMIANIGEIKQPYFSHAVNCTCSGESYLHKLAKLLIKEKFDKSDHFPLTFIRNVQCKEKDNNCIFFGEYDCIEYEQRICMDLKNWNGKSVYDTCEEEKAVEGFRPDLWLYSSKNPNLETTFIEIYKTHESTDSKKSSKFRIIETLPIKSEEDIHVILKAGFVEDINCKLYNFAPRLPKIRKIDIPVCRFLLYENGTARTTTIECKQLKEKIDKKAILELNIQGFGISDDTPNSIQTGLLYYLRDGNKLKNCCLCKYYRYNQYYEKNICILYQKLDLQDPHPKQIQASKCPKYEFDPVFNKFTMEELRKVVSKVYII